MKTTTLLGSVLVLSGVLAGASVEAKGRAPAQATERRLFSEQVEASSFLWNDWNKFQENYHPNYVADGDPATAWVEGVKGGGEGQWLRLRTPLDGTSAVRLRIMNGYQKSPALFTANARPKTITVLLLPSKATQVIQLEDKVGWQEFTVTQPAGTLDAVELRVDKVYPGKRYDDTCISEVEVYATSTAPQNAAFEKSKFDRLQAWKSARVNAAKDMSALAKGGAPAEKTMPVQPSYKVDQSSGGDFDYEALWTRCKSAAKCHLRELLTMVRGVKDFAAFTASLDIAQQVADGKLKNFFPARLVLRDTRDVPENDGIQVPYMGSSLFNWGMSSLRAPALGKLAAFNADDLGVIQDKKLKHSFDKIVAGKAAGCKKGLTATWAMYDTPSANTQTHVRALLTARCGMVEQREGKSMESDFEIATYDADGRLELVISSDTVSRFKWDNGVVVAGASVGLDGSRVDINAPVVVARP